MKDIYVLVPFFFVSSNTINPTQLIDVTMGLVRKKTKRKKIVIIQNSNSVKI
jgi:hypothetical protein